MKKSLKEFLVIGIYEDNQQRYADTFQARTPAEAEKKAKKVAREFEKTELEVAAVIEGDLSKIKVVG